MEYSEIRPEPVRKQIASIQDDLYQVRHVLHRHPELSGQEVMTARVIRGELDKIGITWRAVHGTGTYAELQGFSDGPCIILRADIDALPITEESACPFPSENRGVMHACGHDIHTTALLGAARLLAGRRQWLKGSVRFIFQQAEEMGHGSQYFLAENVTDGAKRIYGFHVAPERLMGTAVLTDGTDAASCDYMRIRLHGQNAHIAKPHLGRDALAAASDIALHLRGFAGAWDPTDNCLVGVGKISAGSAWNIIADYAEIEGTVRALSMDTRQRLLQAVEGLVQRIARLYQVSAEIEFEMNTPCLVNDGRAYEVMYSAAAKTLGGGDKIIKEDVPFGFGGDDFAAFAQEIPGCFIHVGAAPAYAPGQAVPLHSPNLFIDDRVINIGCEILARCAFEHLIEREKLS